MSATMSDVPHVDEKDEKYVADKAKVRELVLRHYPEHAEVLLPALGVDQ